MKMKMAAILMAATMIAVPCVFAGPHGGGGHHHGGGPHGGGGHHHGGGPRYYRGGYYRYGGPGYYYGGYYRYGAPGYYYGGLGLAADIVNLVDASLGVVAGVVTAPLGYYPRTVYCPPAQVPYATPAVVPAPGYCTQPVPVTTTVAQPVVYQPTPVVPQSVYRPMYTVRY